MQTGLQRHALALVAGLAFTILGSLWASSGPGQVEPLSPEDEKLADELAKEYEPELRQLIKPAYVYNYVKSASLEQSFAQSTDTNDPRIRTHLADTAHYFWISPELTAKRTNWKNWTGNVPGLYAALDPFSSMEYGDILFRIELPKDFRFLDVTSRGFFSRSDLTIELGDKQSFLIHSFVSHRERHLANRVLQKLRAEGFLYNWMGTFQPSCGKNNTGAFVITDTGKIKRARMFSRGLFGKDASETKRIAEEWLPTHEYGCRGLEEWARPVGLFTKDKT